MTDVCCTPCGVISGRPYLTRGSKNLGSTANAKRLTSYQSCVLQRVPGCALSSFPETTAVVPPHPERVIPVLSSALSMHVWLRRPGASGIAASSVKASQSAT